MFIRKSMAFATAALISLSAQASDFGFAPAPEAEIEVPASVELNFPNDTAVLIFSVQAEGDSLAEVQSRVNASMEKGQKAIKDFSSLAVVENNGYSSSPLWTNPQKGEAPKIKGWKVLQSIKVTTPDVQGVASLVQVAQDADLGLAAVSFSLSEEMKKEADDRLLEAVVSHLNHRILTIAQALNIPSSSVQIKKLNFEGTPLLEGGAPIVRMMKADHASNRVALPEFEVGTTSVSLSVSAVLKAGSAK